MKRILTITTVLLPIIAIVLFVSQILFTNNLAEDGSTLKHISDKISDLEIENERLEQHIASQSSLLVIQKRAQEKGFQEAKQFLTIAQGQYLVAFNQKR